MKICVFGAGAIGGNLATRLAASGVDVSVIARGEQLVAIQRDGLTLETPKETVHATVRASADARDLGEQDVVLVTVKAPALPDVAAGIRPLLGPETPVVFVMNGIPWWYFYKHGGPYDGRRLPLIDPGDVVWNAVGPQRAIGSIINSSNSVVRPGVIRNTSGRAALVLGEPDGSRSARVQGIADAINASTASATVTMRIRDEVWTKLLANMSSNPLTFLAQSALGPVIGDPVLVAAVRTIAKEAAAIARALGCDVSLDVDAAFSAASQHKPSIVQDLERGRPLELDAMFTVPVEFGKMLGVDTPLLDLMVRLMKLRAQGTGLYPAS
jgi:2-dehydropantoate 2-reductase